MDLYVSHSDVNDQVTNITYVQTIHSIRLMQKDNARYMTQVRISLTNVLYMAQQANFYLRAIGTVVVHQTSIV